MAVGFDGTNDHLTVPSALVLGGAFTVEAWVKSANVVANWARVIDFGLAKKERASEGKKILGTPYYVAPETILGSAIDRRADLYSLGVVLYEMLTGGLPFLGPSMSNLMFQHLEERPPPLEAKLPNVTPSR